MRKTTNQLKWGSFLSYIQMFLNIFIGIIYTPIMIRLLGKSEYGLYQTVSSTIALLGILNLGFSSGYIRYYAKYKKDNDENSIYKLNGLFIIIFTIIGLIAFICGTFLSFHLNIVFDTGLNTQEYEIARVLMLLLTINLAISFPMSVFSSIISANEKFIFQKLLSMFKTVVGPLVTLPLLLMGYRSIAMVLITILIALISDAVNVYYVVGVLKNEFIFVGFEKGIFRSLFTYTVFIAINIIVDQINWNIDKLLLGRFKGTGTVAVYSVGYSLYSYYMLFSTAITAVFIPRVHKIVNETSNNFKRQRRELTQLFTKVGRIQFLILGLIASGLVFFGKNFIIKYWAGSGYEESYYVALLLVLPASIALIQNIGVEIQRAENKHQFRSIVYLIMALVNLGLSIVLCQKYGAVGSTIGTAMAFILCNGLIINIYYHKHCNIDIVYFWKNILHMSRGLIIPICFGCYINWKSESQSVIGLLISIMIYSLIYVGSMWIAGMNEYEKNFLKIPVKKILRK